MTSSVGCRSVATMINDDPARPVVGRQPRLAHGMDYIVESPITSQRLVYVLARFLYNWATFHHGLELGCDRRYPTSFSSKSIFNLRHFRAGASRAIFFTGSSSRVYLLINHSISNLTCILAFVLILQILQHHCYSTQ